MSDVKKKRTKMDTNSIKTKENSITTENDQHNTPSKILNSWRIFYKK